MRLDPYQGMVVMTVPLSLSWVATQYWSPMASSCKVSTIMLLMLQQLEAPIH